MIGYTAEGLGARVFPECTMYMDAKRSKLERRGELKNLPFSTRGVTTDRVFDRPANSDNPPLFRVPYEQHAAKRDGGR